MEEWIKFLKMLGGCSVTQRIKQIKQPRGGYLPPKKFTAVPLGEGMDALNPNENIYPTLVGLAVDYMTRFLSGTSVEDSFHISMLGAELIGEKEKARKLMADIRGLDEVSIVNAVKLSGFDVCYRSGITGYKPVELFRPDSPTIRNIRTMIERSLQFFEKYGPKQLDGFTFEGGYTDIVSTGDGDFTTSDTLWDFKVSKMPIKKEHTLQLLMYWRMGLHSVHPEFTDVTYLGIYNPRMNIVYRIATDEIPKEVIAEIETKVIGYE